MEGVRGGKRECCTQRPEQTTEDQKFLKQCAVGRMFSLQQSRYFKPIFLFVSVTNKKPAQVFLTKVKQFEGSSSFVRRSQWSISQLRQVNGIDSVRDCPEFDLIFENGSDQWTAGSAGEKCVFVQVLHHTCQRFIPERKPEFINCPSKLLGGNSILHEAADSVSSAVQKASQALNERGERLGRVEEKTGEMMNSAQHFADTAHKLAMKHKC
ncbi:syntaxin-binding protein 6-like [Sinocyclocheilus rhinocerous]|uniref:syntaxin-binding protein 6-like n=1 Tax=Sinocyclocheilus rhinocerous TaxID=307959 RepID=UPI0007BAC397|nr:PREDICTED: syntaxin-binding protein 6-like [Sinocyclocheilus rhinocerous]